MGNQQSSYKETIKIIIDGVQKEYPVKYHNNYEELPQKVKDDVIQVLKDEIKKKYELNGNFFAMLFFNNKPYKEMVFEDKYCSLHYTHLVNPILKEIIPYCNTLFGPHVPYHIEDYGSSFRIVFVYNI